MDSGFRELVYAAMRAMHDMPEPSDGVRVGNLTGNETIAYDAIVRSHDAEIADLRRQLAEQGEQRAGELEGLRKSGRDIRDRFLATTRALAATVDAADALARCEHDPKLCRATCTCGGWEARNAARSEFYRRYRALKDSPAVPDDQRAALRACGELFQWLNRLGGLGLDKHERISHALTLSAVQAALRDAVTPADIAPFLPPLREGDGT